MKKVFSRVRDERRGELSRVVLALSVFFACEVCSNSFSSKVMLLLNGAMMDRRIEKNLSRYII